MSKIFSLGVMTGTSCDGADLALLQIKQGDETLAHTASHSFPEPLRQRLRAAQAGKLDIPETAVLTRDYSAWLALVCRRTLTRWRVPASGVLIAIHGQTVWHAPERGISVQLLDPTIVAFQTGCTVTAAFRQPDLARGGQGAPLVPLYHWMRANSGSFAKTLPFAIHNIGGIANLTYITRNQQRLIAFDTGPGNALIDLAAEQASGGRLKFDKDGKLAASALDAIDWRAIEKLGRHAFFRTPPPKSTGRELFSGAFLRQLPGRGATRVANATALTAHTMAKAHVEFILKKGHVLNGVFAAGGGARNPTLLRLFSREIARLSGEEIPIGVLPDSFAPAQYLEAMAFARLGYEALKGNAVSLAIVTGAVENAFGAGIFPGENYRRLLKRLNLT